MKVLLVLALVLVAAATALAYGHPAVTAGVSAVAAEAASHPTEPAVLLLSGSAMLGLAGALRRLPL